MKRIVALAACVAMLMGGCGFTWKQQPILFNLVVDSDPQGAEIYYRTRIDEWKDSHHVTPYEVKHLPVAVWQFKLSKEGYQDHTFWFDANYDDNKSVEYDLFPNNKFSPSAPFEIRDGWVYDCINVDAKVGIVEPNYTNQDCWPENKRPQKKVKP